LVVAGATGITAGASASYGWPNIVYEAKKREVGNGVRGAV